METQLEKILRELENLRHDIVLLSGKVQIIGEQNYQLKKVLTVMAESQRSREDDFDEAMGIINESSW
jgi:hypothetical protein